MTTTLARDITAIDRIIPISGPSAGAGPGHPFLIEDEIVILLDFEDVPASVGQTRPIGPDPTSWFVQRGAFETDAVGHGAGATVAAVRPAFSQSLTLYEPAPVPSGSGPHPDLVGHETLGLAAGDHTHPAGSHPDLAAHESLGLADAVHAHAYAATSHGHAEADVTSLTTDLAGKAASTHNHDAAYATVGHTHPGGPSELYAVGDLFLTTRTGDPASLLGYGTWSHISEAGVIVGQKTGDAAYGNVGAVVGAWSHDHGFTQPSDHAALTHAGATVADHVALAHSAHAGATVADHTGLTHAGATVADHSSHTHAYTQVPNHVHVQNVNSATTGGLSGYTPDTSTNTSVASGYSTANPTGGVASGTTANEGAALVHSVGQATAHGTAGTVSHTIGQASAHSDHAAQTHTVGQAGQHAAQAHAGGLVASGTVGPPAFVCHIWQRTA